MIVGSGTDRHSKANPACRSRKTDKPCDNQKGNVAWKGRRTSTDNDYFIDKTLRSVR